MCIIAIKPSTKPMFKDDVIKTMFENNPNGAGLMFITKSGKVHIEKGFMKVTPLLDYVHEHAKELAKTDVIMHFRISTSGRNDGLTCHPYPVFSNNVRTSCDVELAMAHNGMLDSYGYRGNQDVNDSQVFIKDCLRKLPHNFIYNKAIMNLISNAIGTNKLAFLDSKGYHCIGNYVSADGYYYSNESYKKRSYSFGYTPKLVSCRTTKQTSTEDDVFDENQMSLFDEEPLNSKMFKTYEHVKNNGKYNTELSASKYIELKAAIMETCNCADPWGELDYIYYDDENVYELDNENSRIVRRKFKVGEREMFGLCY